MNQLKAISTIRDSNLISLKICNNYNVINHAHNEIEIVFVVKGQLSVSIKDEQYTVEQTNLIMINSNEFHTIQSDVDCLYVIIHINYLLLASYLNQKSFIFQRELLENKQIKKNIRICIEELLAVFINRGKQFIELEIQEKAFQLCSSIIPLLKQTNKYIGLEVQLNSEGQSERLSDILTYIEIHYAEKITLEDIAGKFYLSVPYLSKFFKIKMGENFLQYLNKVRLAHAVNDLIYQDKSLTRVALDNGFPNLPAFNRVFYDKYNEKPQDYKRKVEIENVTNIYNDENNTTINRVDLLEIENYLDNSQNKINIEVIDENKIDKIILNTNNTSDIVKYWNKLVNIGSATDLLNSDIQDQIVQFKNEQKFKYARFWGIFGNEMLPYNRIDNKIEYNFSNINIVLDFLVRNNIIPYIELGPKPKMVSKTFKEVFILKSNEQNTIEEWGELSKLFLIHCIERYGVDEVEKWYFEIWRPNFDFREKREVNEEEFSNIINKSRFETAEHFQEYYKIFSTFKNISNELIPSAKVGGCEFGMDLGLKRLELLLKEWIKETLQPDFISISLFAIDIIDSNKEINIKNFQSPNPNYINLKIKQVQRLLKKVGYDDMELHVSEWNLSYTNRNYINDSCFKATFIAKNIIDNIGHKNLNIFGYWLLSDSFSDYRDTNNFLYGGAGLFTKNGIKKPSYHVFSLLNRLGNCLIAKGENYIITKKKGNRYQILLFNYKHFDLNYYLIPEENISYNSQNNIFENQDNQSIELELQDVSNGRYKLKEITLNSEHGSILDEWVSSGKINNLKRDEIKYLKETCVPKMKIKQLEIQNNKIILNSNIAPHEVKLFEIDLIRD